VARSRKPKPGELRIDQTAAVPVATYEYTDDAKDNYASTLASMSRISRFRVDPANLEVYDPPEKARVPVDGAWAMITRRLPAIEHNLDLEFSVGRILWVERTRGTDDRGFLKGGVYKAMCRSPWGEVHLWPYEYRTVDVPAILEMWTASEIVFHPTAIDDARFTEVAFYARTRGISPGDAAVMALGSLSGLVGWFEPHPGLAEACEAMERRVHAPWPTRA
jgi:hypothetical protein